MPKPLSPEQIDAMRAVPLGEMPNKLRIAIALAKVKQAEVCEETGLTPSMVSNFVLGKYTTLTIDTARKLAEFFGCQIEDLFPAREAVA
jgi:transcriptional regulator with XRE-family HTH domain